MGGGCVVIMGPSTVVSSGGITVGGCVVIMGPSGVVTSGVVVVVVVVEEVVVVGVVVVEGVVVVVVLCKLQVCTKLESNSFGFGQLLHT